MDNFQVTFKNGIMFKQMIEVCKEIVQDVTMCFCNNGIELNAMDNAHVALLHLNISKDMFSHYSVFRETKISLSLKHLFSILKCLKDKYELTLCYKNDNKLKIMMESKDNKRYTFELNLFQMEHTPLVPPDTKPDAYFEMESASFSDTLKNLSNIFGGSEVIIQAKNDFCLFKTKGDVGSVEYVELLDVIQCVKPIEMRFSLKYLLMFAKACIFHDTVKIIMFEEEPIQVRYEIQKDCYLGFFLAPRFDED